MAQVEKTFIQRLKEKQLENALAAMETPKGKENFDYGKACGIHYGLRLAEQLFEEAIGEDHDRT